MIVAIAVNTTNYQLANKWFDRCADLNSASLKNQELLLLAPGNLQFPPSHSLWKVNRVRDRSAVSGFPFQLNSAYVQLAWNMWYAKREQPWLLCDPAFVPVDSFWLSKLEDAYAAAGKPFLVEIVPGAAGEPPHPRPLCILPPDAVRQNPDAVSEKRPRLPWYVRGVHELTPKKIAETNLFSQLFVSTVQGDRPTAPVPVTPSLREHQQVVSSPVAEPTPPVPPISRLPNYSMSELCEVIAYNVKSETARKKLMDFLLEKKFHRKDFGATTELVNAK